MLSWAVLSTSNLSVKTKRTKNAKEGVKSYTRQSALLRVLLKNHNISTYEKDSSSASLCWLEEDLGFGLTGQLKKKKQGR